MVFEELSCDLSGKYLSTQVDNAVMGAIMYVLPLSYCAVT